jgi:hypothetical protein
VAVVAGLLLMRRFSFNSNTDSNSNFNFIFLLDEVHLKPQRLERRVRGGQREHVCRPSHLAVPTPAAGPRPRDCVHRASWCGGPSATRARARAAARAKAAALNQWRPNAPPLPPAGVPTELSVAYAAATSTHTTYPAAAAAAAAAAATAAAAHATGTSTDVIDATVVVIVVVVIVLPPPCEVAPSRDLQIHAHLRQLQPRGLQLNFHHVAGAQQPRRLLLLLRLRLFEPTLERRVAGPKGGRAGSE